MAQFALCGTAPAQEQIKDALARRAVLLCTAGRAIGAGGDGGRIMVTGGMRRGQGRCLR